MTALLLQLLLVSLWPALLVVLAAIGMFVGLFVWDRMFAYEESRADLDVTEAERGPSNVYYLTAQIEADHRERRVVRLLNRS